ncbi:transposase (fragment) [Ralstonia solanacearum CFBP2957]
MLEAFADARGDRDTRRSAPPGERLGSRDSVLCVPTGGTKVIYTTNAIENINAHVRKIIKTRGHFPTDDAATKLIWLALRNITAGWSRAAHDWKQAMNQFAILYADRFVRPSV